jgi:hypothetical protein
MFAGIVVVASNYLIGKRKLKEYLIGEYVGIKMWEMWAVVVSALFIYHNITGII